MSRRAVRVTALALVAGVACATLAMPGRAVAHSSLIGTSPKQDGTVREPVRNVELRFNEDIQQKFATIAVTDPDGKRVSTGKPAVDGGTVEQPVGDFVTTGKYLVGWRVVSADGHPVSGKFTFTVTKGALVLPSATPKSTSASPSPTGAPATKAAGKQQEDNRSFVERHAAHILIGAVIVLAGIAVIVWERRRRSQGT